MTASTQIDRITPPRRRLPVWLGALALLLVAGAGTFFYTKNGAAKADEAGKKESAPVTLEFAPGAGLA